MSLCFATSLDAPTGISCYHAIIRQWHSSTRSTPLSPQHVSPCLCAPPAHRRAVATHLTPFLHFHIRPPCYSFSPCFVLDTLSIAFHTPFYSVGSLKLKKIRNFARNQKDTANTLLFDETPSDTTVLLWVINHR